jgi:hypothetical protein
MSFTANARYSRHSASNHFVFHPVLNSNYPGYLNDIRGNCYSVMSYVKVLRLRVELPTLRSECDLTRLAITVLGNADVRTDRSLGKFVLRQSLRGLTNHRARAVHKFVRNSDRLAGTETILITLFPRVTESVDKQLHLLRVGSLGVLTGGPSVLILNGQSREIERGITGSLRSVRFRLAGRSVGGGVGLGGLSRLCHF